MTHKEYLQKKTDAELKANLSTLRAMGHRHLILAVQAEFSARRAADAADIDMLAILMGG